MQGLQFTNIHKNYGQVKVLHDINFEVKKGEFIVFVGPSGCGKSTLLRMIAGLEEITSGELAIEGDVVNHIPPAQRGIAMVISVLCTYPHMSVYDNMAFGMRIAKLDKAEMDKRVRDAAEILQLTEYLSRLPKALSGGQRQRVAIGRAIVRDPKVFLFDEPLSNLDAALRVATRIEISRLKENLPDATMIYVTHDQVEAMTLADRIVVLNQGRVEQIGTPLELYEKPDNLFVAQFIGSPAMNIVDGQQDDVDLSFLSNDITDQPGLKVGLRPEDVVLDNSANVLLTAEVSHSESLGEVTLVYASHSACQNLLVAKLQGHHEFEKGQKISFGSDLSRLHFFGENGMSLRG